MKSDANCYFQQLRTEDSVIISTHTIFHPCLDVSAIKEVEDIPRSLCNKKQAQKSVKRHPISIYDADQDYVLDEWVEAHDIFKNLCCTSLLSFVRFH